MLRLSCGYSTNRFHVGRYPVVLSLRLVSALFAGFASTGFTAFGSGWSYSEAKLTVVTSGKGCCCCACGLKDFGIPTLCEVLNAEPSEAPLSPAQYSNPSSTDPTTTK